MTSKFAQIKNSPPPGMELDIYENSVISGLTGIAPDRPESAGDGRYDRPFPPPDEAYGYDAARHRYLARTKSEEIHGLLETEERELWDLAERRVWADAWHAGDARSDSPGAPSWERPFIGGNREW